jgi:Glycosyltransferase like family
MSDMVICIATRMWDDWTNCVDTWRLTSTSRRWDKFCIVKNKDVVPALQESYEQTTEPIIGYLHDDLEIYERGWDSRVLREFVDPTVGLVGFAGALGHGTPNLYTAPYHLPNLARQQFLSNMRDAEKHGARFTGERDVAVLDGLALFVRRSVLEKAGGWPVNEKYGYWLYSEWLCCETRRQGYRIRLVGIDCEHLGGKSSGHIAASPTYDEAHRYLWENNWDMLPYRVPE